MSLLCRKNQKSLQMANYYCLRIMLRGECCCSQWGHNIVQCTSNCTVLYIILYSVHPTVLYCTSLCIDIGIVCIVCRWQQAFVTLGLVHTKFRISRRKRNKNENISTHWLVAQASSDKNWRSKISLDCPFKSSRLRLLL